jgi:hypothetical protein
MSGMVGVAITTAVVILLLIGYMLSYFALVDRVALSSGGLLGSSYVLGPHYAIEGETVYHFFAPAHWIDQRLRPNYWEKPTIVFLRD